MTQISVNSHFGEWMQGQMGPDGPLALAALDCDAMAVRATTEPTDGFVFENGGLLGKVPSGMGDWLRREGYKKVLAFQTGQAS